MLLGRTNSPFKYISADDHISIKNKQNNFYFQPLNPEERQCYENLSKAHYTDFYRALGPPPVELGTKQQNEKTFDLARASSSGSGKLPGGLTEVSSYATPTSSRDAERRTSTTSNDGHQSDVSNTNSTLNETFGLDDKLFTGYDEVYICFSISENFRTVISDVK